MKQRIKESHSLYEEWITIYLVEPLAPLLWAKSLKNMHWVNSKRASTGLERMVHVSLQFAECLTVSTLGKDTSLPSAPLGKTCVC